MSDPDHAERPARSGLSPAAWSAVGAIAVAVIGGAVTLTAAWWQRQPAAPSAASEPAPKAEPAKAADDPANWTGAYLGAAQTAGEAPFTVEVVITPGCALNAACGTIRVPKCAGKLSLVAVGEAGAEFNVSDFDASSDPQICKPGAGEVLKAQADGSLAYHATYSGARGVLRRR